VVASGGGYGIMLGLLYHRSARWVMMGADEFFDFLQLISECHCKSWDICGCGSIVWCWVISVDYTGCFDICWVRLMTGFFTCLWLLLRSAAWEDV